MLWGSWCWICCRQTRNCCVFLENESGIALAPGKVSAQRRSAVVIYILFLFFLYLLSGNLWFSLNSTEWLDTDEFGAKNNGHQTCRAAIDVVGS